MPEKKRPLEVFKNEEEVKAKVKITKAVKNEATVRKVVRKEGNSVKKEVKIVKPVKKVATKRELQTLIQKKNVKDESKVNQGTDLPVEGQFELNALMTQVLEEELENIMTQVWKTLPNLASTDVERFVTERLKNDAIVELKNVLGLNVTKRLLNVYNPLFVKIQFSGRPENGFLSKFLKNYNITSFKRIDRETNTFAAKLDTIADFDRICTANDLKCGSAQLNVTPCYKFKKCPNNLNTIYNSRTESENYLEDTDRSKNDKSDQEISKQEILTPDKAKPVEKSTQEIKTEQIKIANENKIVKGNKLDKKNSKLLRAKKTKNEMYEVNQTDPKLNEEMNDEEILALISGGVVLDECSGSDKE